MRVVYNPETRRYEPVMQQPQAQVQIPEPAPPQAPIQSDPRTPLPTPQQVQQQPALVQQPAPGTPSNVPYDTQAMAAQGAALNQQQAALNQEALQAQQQAGQSYIDQLAGITSRYGQQYQISAEEAQQAAKQAKRRQIFNALSDGMSTLANLYYTTKGAVPAQLDSFTTKYQQQYELARAKREKLQDELRNMIANSERTLADKQILAQQQLYDMHKKAKKAELDSERDLDDKIRKADAENVKFSEKSKQDEAKRKEQREIAEMQDATRRAQAQASDATRREQIRVTDAQRRELQQPRVAADNSRAYHNDIATHQKKHGKPYTIALEDGENLVAGDTSLLSLVDDVRSDVVGEIDTQIKAAENNKDLPRKEREDLLRGLRNEKRAIETVYANAKREQEKISFVSQYVKMAPKALEKLRSLADEYAEELEKIEKRYPERNYDDASLAPLNPLLDTTNILPEIDWL